MLPPATLVFGLSGLDRRDLIAAWRAGARGTIGLIVDEGDDAKPFRAPGGARDATEDANAVRLSGCACCTARVGLTRAIAKLCRGARMASLIIDLNAGAHPAELIDAMRREDSGGAPWLAGAVAVLAGEHLREDLPARLRAWIIEQIEAADRLIVRSTLPLDARARLRAESLLVRWASFAPRVEWWLPHQRPPAMSQPDQASAGGAAAVLMALAADSPRWRWAWRADPRSVFDRRGLGEALEPWLEDAAMDVRAVFRTEREWYGLAQGRWEPSLWRRDSRIEIDFDASEHARSFRAFLELRRALDGPLRGG